METALTLSPKTLTARIVRGTTLADRQLAFDSGWNQDREAIQSAKANMRAVRVRYGFADADAPILTPPDANSKLDKGATPAYGLTLQSHVTRLMDGSRVNACPSAGHCVRVCVLNNGSGRYASVQQARDYKTEFVATDPLSALTLIGAELRRAVDRKGLITFRPNVNSDVDWRAVIGDRLRGLPGITSYGYSKRPDVAHGDSGLSVEAYSWSERTTAEDLAFCDETVTPIAAVTNRRPGDPITQWHPTRRVVDADLTDEWMLGDGDVIGDLSAKGKARQLIGKSGFVRMVY